MARRIALVVVLFLAVPLGGSMRAESAPPAPVAKPLKPAPVHRVHVARPKPAGTLVAHVRPGREVLVRSGGAITRVSSGTEFGSRQTFAVTRVLPGRRYRVLLSDGRIGSVPPAPGPLHPSRPHVTIEVDLSARLLRVHRGARVTRTIRVGTGAS